MGRKSWLGEATSCTPGDYLKLTMSPTDPLKFWMCERSLSGGSDTLLWEPQLDLKNNLADSLVTNRFFNFISVFAFPHNGMQIYGWALAYQGDSALTPADKVRGFIVKLFKSASSSTDSTYYVIRESESTTNVETKYDQNTFRIPEIYLTATHTGLGKVRLDFKSRTTNAVVFSHTDSGERQGYLTKANPLTP